VVILCVSSVGVMASTSFSNRADNRIVMLTLSHGNTCKKGDWVFCLKNGYVGRVLKVLNDMAISEEIISVRYAEYGDQYRIF